MRKSIRITHYVLLDPNSSGIVRRPVRAPHGANRDACAFVLGVNEPAVADVDAYVREAALIGVREEEQIARLEVLSAYPRAASYLGTHVAGHGLACLGEDIGYKAAAIESLGRHSAEAITRPNIGQSDADEGT